MPDDSNKSFLGLLGASTILGSAMPMLIILGGLAGLMLSPSPTFVTLPASLQMLAGLLSTGPFSLFMGRYGRKAGFLVGAGFAIVGGCFGMQALFHASFGLLCLAHMAFGAALACYQYFRFAAGEVVSQKWQPVAISIMLTSGLVAALAGPQVFIFAKDLFAPVPFAGAYAAISGITLVGLLPLAVVRLPKTTRPQNGAISDRGAALTILRRKSVRSAIQLAALSQAIMVLLMAPTPLAMIGCGLDEEVAGDVIRWHVVAMFAPSFFTGFVIQKYGSRRVVTMGLLTMILSAIMAASGQSSGQFHAALVLLGIGWNFGFIGATNMLTLAMTPSERPVAQGVNDTVVALASTLSAFASGALVTGFGWTILAIAALPILCVGILLSLQSPATGRA